MRHMLPPHVLRTIDAALDEDIGQGDVTTRLTVPSGAIGKGRIVAKQSLVVSGLDIFAAVMHRVDPDLEVEALADPGDQVPKGAVLATLKGSIASQLIAERVALNFLQRLCGIATLTRQFVEALPVGSKTRITDTRKTTPGLRFLERRAVRDGGGWNHRDDLGGGVLIKENHIAAAGSIAAAIRACLERAPHPLRIEVEVRSAEELEEAVAAGADLALLDNMDREQQRRCVSLVAGQVFLEASGSVKLEEVRSIAETGVDAISVGALTHSVPAVDISYLIEGALP